MTVPPMPLRRLLRLFFLTALIAPAARAAGNLGEAVEKFTVTDIRFSRRTLDDFGPHKAYIFVFTASGCPLAQRYLPRVKELATAFAARDVQFVAVNCAADDSLMDTAWQGMECGAEFPFVKDFSGECAKALGVTRTPE